MAARSAPVDPAQSGRLGYRLGMADSRPGSDPSSTYVGEDWAGRRVEAQAFEDVQFLDCDLSEIATVGAVFAQCAFRGVRFNASTHTDTAFTNCTFSRCSFFDARFIRTKLVGSGFDACRFDLLRVEAGDWSYLSAPGADLTGADLRGVRMREADLSGAKCAGARLRNLDLSGAWLRGADLTGTDLRGSDLSSLDPREVTLARAIVDTRQVVQLALTLGLDVREAEDD